MKRAFDNGNAITPGEAACSPHCAHYGFGTGIRKTHFLYVRAKCLNLLHNLGIEFSSKARQGAALCNLLDDGSIDSLIPVAENNRAVAEPEIDILLAVAVR